MSDLRIAAVSRTEFGKGAARRARRDGLVPAVLYGHASDPKHVTLPARELAAILRANGRNVILTVEIDGKSELALTKQIVVHPLRNYIEHVDLLSVKKGEKLTVEVPVVAVGEAKGLVVIELNTVTIEAATTAIPETIEFDATNAVAGTAFLASDLQLPAGATLITDAKAQVAKIAGKAAREEGDEAEEAAE
jgi:large subunit ribosomal protein L25